MEKLKKVLQDWLAALVLPVALFAAAVMPTTSAAGDEFALDTGRRGGGEGDPLDTNDAGGDGDGGDDIHDANGTSAGRNDLLRQLMQSTRVLLVPQYNGATLTFKLIFLSESTEIVEARHAK